MRLQRRQFLQTTAAWLLWQSSRSMAGAALRSLHFEHNPFTMGVASGDPASDGVVLWTRIDPGQNGSMGTLVDPIPVQYEVARDEAMRHIVRKGVVSAEPELGYSVHVELSGLDPASSYFYRFHAGDATSTIGRTRTAPRAGDAQQRVRFAFASCQHYEYGFFNAHRDIAKQDLDAVLFLGDYIYEYHQKRNAVRQHVLDEVISLGDYRRHYAQYRSDPDLQAAHAAHPWIVTLDDHEVENNWAGLFPEWSHPQPDFRARRSAAFQAYYESMPLRRASLPVNDGTQIYRTLPYGKLAQFTVLDTRQFRTRQPCEDDFKPSCDARFNPDATMMGKQQEQWFADTLRGSSATWNILANQVMVAELKMPSNGQILYNMDQWDGYVQPRKRLLDTLASNVSKNPVVVTGDFHQTWASNLKQDFAKPDSAVIASELVGTSITSGGDGMDVGPHAAENKAANPHLLYNNDRRGYFLCELTSDAMHSELRTLDRVTTHDSNVTVAAKFVTRAGQPGLIQEA